MSKEKVGEAYLNLNKNLKAVIDAASTEKQKDDCAYVMSSILVSTVAIKLMGLAACRTGNMQEAIMKLERKLLDALHEFHEEKSAEHEVIEEAHEVSR